MCVCVFDYGRKCFQVLTNCYEWVCRGIVIPLVFYTIIFEMFAFTMY